MTAVEDDEFSWRSKFMPVLALADVLLSSYTLFSSSTAIIHTVFLLKMQTDINKKNCVTFTNLFETSQKQYFYSYVKVQTLH